MIQTYCLRYVVPFTYRETYKEAIEKIESNNACWKRNRKQQSSFAYQGVQSDLYDYVQEEFCFLDDHEESGVNTGCSWVYESKQKLLELLYKEEQTEVSFDIQSMGLYLFRNELGFLWYEVSFVQSAISYELLLQFQSRFRELNLKRTDSCFCTPATESDYEMVAKNGTLLKRMNMGDWIARQLACLEIHFFDERPSIVSGNLVPHKARLFTYAVFDKAATLTSREEKEIAYHLANGYNESFHFSEELLDEMKQPFQDAVWYATQDGAAYLVWPEDDCKQIFTSYVSKKIRLDYFALYVKTLYQSYSLLIYARKIHYCVCADPNRQNTTGKEDVVTDLYHQMNLFLTKSMATSVSHIHHLSEFYIYLKKQLRVHEDVKSVSAGMDALENMQREYRRIREREKADEEWRAEKERDHEEKERDNMTQRIMGTVAFLSIFSALVDGYDFIGKFTGKEWKTFPLCIQIAEIIFFVGIIIFIICIGFMLIKNWRQKKLGERYEESMGDYTKDL